MANKVLLKKSSVAAKVPLTTDLDYGELALNYTDGKLYYKTAGNAINYLDAINTTATLTNKTLSAVTLTGSLTVSNGIGTSGQVLASTGAGVQWVAASTGGTTSVFNANAQSDLGYVYDSVTIIEDLGTPLGTTTVSYDMAVLNVGGVVSLENLDSSVRSDYLSQAIIFGF